MHTGTLYCVYQGLLYVCTQLCSRKKHLRTWYKLRSNYGEKLYDIYPGQLTSLPAVSISILLIGVGDADTCMFKKFKVLDNIVYRTKTHVCPVTS